MRYAEEESDSHPALTNDGEGPVGGAEMKTECRGPRPGNGSEGSLSKFMTFNISAPRAGGLGAPWGEE